VGSVDQVAQLFERRQGGEGKGAPLIDRRRGGEAETGAVLGGAQARAKALARALRDSPGAEQLALTVLVARGLSGLWIQRRWRSEDVGELLEQAACIAGVPVDSFTLGVSLYALCDPGLLELPPQLAIEAQIALLRALARLTDVSLWHRDSDGRLKCLVHDGGREPSRRAREVAREALEGREAGGAGARLLFGVAVMRWQRPHAALVGRVAHGGRERGVAFLDQAAAMIGPMLERQALLERNAARERSLVRASERRLTRLGFDLHDQPLQEVAALGTDMRAFRLQLERSDGGADHREILIGRVQDLEARLAALDTGLRAVCHSLEPPTLLARPMREVLERETDAYAARTEMDVALSVDGELDRLTDSQRIVLVRIVQECLSNAREHSGASEVRVEVRSTDSYIEASVTDNGRGFDVEGTLLEAARRGRLGLVGVHERVRLLGGTCDVASRPGGPTTVSVCLSRWHRLPLPSSAEADAS
jgi:signal transduction histidine kinase